MISEPRCVAPTGDRCGEGVAWQESMVRFLDRHQSLPDSPLYTC
jgi:hypothetical protein